MHEDGWWKVSFLIMLKTDVFAHWSSIGKTGRGRVTCLYVTPHYALKVHFMGQVLNEAFLAAVATVPLMLIVAQPWPSHMLFSKTGSSMTLLCPRHLAVSCTKRMLNKHWIHTNSQYVLLIYLCLYLNHPCNTKWSFNDCWIEHLNLEVWIPIVSYFMSVVSNFNLLHDLKIFTNKSSICKYYCILSPAWHATWACSDHKGRHWFVSLCKRQCAVWRQDAVGAGIPDPGNLVTSGLLDFHLMWVFLEIYF